MSLFSSLGGAISLIGDRLLKLAGRVLLPMTVLLWFTRDFITVIILTVLSEIGDKLDAMVLVLDIRTINANLAQVNALFPIPEFLGMVVAFVALWLSVQVVKWILKFIPTMG